MAIELTDSNFDEVVLNSDKPVLVDFWATWCPPCINIIGPAMDQLSTEYDGKAVIAKLNADNNPQITTRYNVRLLPTLLYFKNGQVVDKQVGAVPKKTLAGKLDAQLT